MKLEDIVIIGAGPAGIAAGIQLKRYGLKPVIIEKNEIGGLLKNANSVENYPGFPDSISGSDLTAYFRKQLENNSLAVYFEEATNLDFRQGIFIIETSKRSISSRIVLTGSGTKPVEFSDFRLSEEIKAKVFYEIYPLLNMKDKRFVIMGAGDAAFDYALNLSRYNNVVILNRGENEKCLPLLKERAKQANNIKYYMQTTIIKITVVSKQKLFIECNNPNGVLKLETHFLIFAIGRKPQLDFLSEGLRNNYKELEQKGLLYFIGDVKNDIYRQTAIAAGDGIKAAMKIRRKLRVITR